MTVVVNLHISTLSSFLQSTLLYMFHLALPLVRKLRASKYSSTTLAKGHRVNQDSHAGLILTDKEVNGRNEQVIRAHSLWKGPYSTKTLLLPPAPSPSCCPLPRIPQNPIWGHVPYIYSSAHHSLPALETGSCCLLGNLSNETSCSTTLSTSGLFHLGPVSLGEGVASRALSWGWGLWHPHTAGAGEERRWNQPGWPSLWASSCTIHFLGFWLSADWDKKRSQILGHEF